MSRKVPFDRIRNWKAEHGILSEGMWEREKFILLNIFILAIVTLSIISLFLLLSIYSNMTTSVKCGFYFGLLLLFLALIVRFVMVVNDFVQGTFGRPLSSTNEVLAFSLLILIYMIIVIIFIIQKWRMGKSMR